MKILFLLLLSFLCFLSFAQKENELQLFRITSAYTSFPDTARTTGHTYKKVLYPAAVHYTDSSVLIAVPPHFKPGKYIDVVFWFHGWWNNIDSAANYFELIKQFVAANRNAVLVLPETAKNAPDSYGGKLEQKAVFKNLLKDVLHKLKTEKIIGKKSKPGNVVLAGHSGAFRVMAHILQNGGAAIKQVILFDGLYSQIDKYTAWIQADALHQFINLYTNRGGGTDEVSDKMMQLLKEKKIQFINPKEEDLQTSMLQTNQVIFIHSLKEHNDVISRPDHNFRLFLENSNAVKALNITN